MDCMNINPAEQEFCNVEEKKKQRVDKATPKVENMLRHMYNCGYQDALDNVAGRTDRKNNAAWDAAARIAGMNAELRHRIFGSYETEQIITDMTFDEANARIEEFDRYIKELEAAPVKSGDYVLDESGRPGLVTNTDTAIHILYNDGKTHKWPKNAKLTKTGQKADIIVERKETCL